jgi:hypothetical protein
MGFNNGEYLVVSARKLLQVSYHKDKQYIMPPPRYW